MAFKKDEIIIIEPKEMFVGKKMLPLPLWNLANTRMKNVPKLMKW
jgi:hypothetical protein